MHTSTHNSAPVTKALSADAANSAGGCNSLQQTQDVHGDLIVQRAPQFVTQVVEHRRIDKTDAYRVAPFLDGDNYLVRSCSCI